MPLLYKYIADPLVVRFLLQGTCKFTPIPELNDPSELTPNLLVEEVVITRDRLRQEGYSEGDMAYLRRQGRLLQRLAPDHQAVGVPATREMATSLIRSPFYDDVPRLAALLESVSKRISCSVGLFCLSRRYNSLPMWAHYASNARGLVVEFEGLETHFRGDDTGVLSCPIAVRYERERTGVSFNPSSHESIFFTKFHDWSYEEEVRVVLPIAECHARELQGGKRLYCHEVPRECVRRVILGWNMGPTESKAVRAAATAINPDVEIRRARFNHGGVVIE